MPILHFAPGNYRSLTSPGRPFSDAIVADPGYDLVRATFTTPQPLEAGFPAARRVVEAAGRPVTALAGFELRIPDVLSPEGFAAFNGPYVEGMKEFGLVGDEGLLVTTRTNVAPTAARVTEPSLFSFTYTVPRSGAAGTAFRLSGAPESRQDGTPNELLQSIVDVLDTKLEALGVSWDQATAVSLYAPTCELDDATLARFGAAGLRGVRWYPSLPPVTNLRYEIDAHGVGTEQEV